jgi:hypothetical protein
LVFNEIQMSLQTPSKNSFPKGSSSLHVIPHRDRGSSPALSRPWGTQASLCWTAPSFVY